jgi:hypothetical protein
MPVGNSRNLYVQRCNIFSRWLGAMGGVTGMCIKHLGDRNLIYGLVRPLKIVA